MISRSKYPTSRQLIIAREETQVGRTTTAFVWAHAS
jgi:hypothetical protein